MWVAGRSPALPALVGSPPAGHRLFRRRCRVPVPVPPRVWGSARAVRPARTSPMNDGLFGLKLALGKELQTYSSPERWGANGDTNPGGSLDWDHRDT